MPGQRDVAQYHVIDNVGIAVEFLARMSAGAVHDLLNVIHKLGDKLERA